MRVFNRAITRTNTTVIMCLTNHAQVKCDVTKMTNFYAFYLEHYTIQ